MRSVFFDASGILEAFDYRGVLIHRQEVQANQKLKLPFTEKNQAKSEINEAKNQSLSKH